MRDDEANLNKDRLALALEAAGLDLWENDLVTGAVTRKATKTFAELGFTEEEIASAVPDIYGLFHPDDVDTVRQAVADHLAGVTPQYRCEFRLRSKQGEWVWFANYGRIMDTHTATPGRRLIGVTFNIDDRKRREEIDSRNRADQAVYGAEKFIQESGDKLAAADKSAIESAIEALKNAMNANDAAAVNRAMEQLTQAQHKAAEALYKQASAAGGGAPGAEPEDAGSRAQGAPGDVIDAEVVEDEKK